MMDAARLPLDLEVEFAYRAGYDFVPLGTSMHSRIEGNSTVVKAKYAAFGDEYCAVGSWGGWCLSMGDDVTGTGPHGRGERRRRALLLPTLSGVLEIEADAILVAMDAKECAALLRERRRIDAQVVALGRLDSGRALAA